MPAALHYSSLKDIELHFELLTFVKKSILYAKIIKSQKVCFKVLNRLQAFYFRSYSTVKKNFTHSNYILNVLQKPRFFNYNGY